MTEPIRPSRRTLLRATALGAGALATGVLGAPLATAAPALVRRDRPVLTHGVQSGDVTTSSGIVWTRADRPSRLIVEVSRDESFRHARRLCGPVLGPDTGGTGKLRVPGLPPGSDIHYRVTAEALDGRGHSEPLTGCFATAPLGRGDVRLVWSGDVVGQNWGINPEHGMTIFSVMADRRPDVFLHSGDTVYADGPLTETVALPGGRTWRNVVTPEKSKVAETLDEYRGQHAYNRLDEHFKRFAASVPSYVQWDDHEVVNNWYPGETLNDRPEYTEKRVDVLSPRAFQAFHEWHPIDRRQAVDGRVYRNFRYGGRVEVFVLDMRTYRDANTSDRTKAGHILGDKQARWLVDALSRSTATWKIIQADMPIGLVVPDGKDIEAVANGLPGKPGGRETELAWVLREISRRRVRNTVWVTADVHYTAAHHYSPDRAAVGDFDPFWEFVSGPLNAGAFGPNTLDPTFGPEAVFVHAPPAANTSPADGYQHFGELNVDGASGALTVDLRDATGASLWTKTLQAEGR
ncbi:alkaline phosphatase D family protein [Amycolatopsis sp. H20-H5]|uniref:alkaline phosphatase D family protein n=1 Tax=Amycolatopsis sp. H20-H5 TaxID=3046309 RepID=UPI002DB8E5D2|nr:alkaline phosphatase D family protein [Amycolatopsis sp. H20-H5]MEC3979081.1 alkaline phosphatase D family protein [Amycolatopsis sp. H20-H5]